MRRGWPLQALTSLREGKCSVPASKPLSPSWQSRESWPGEKQFTGEVTPWPGGLRVGQEGEAATFSPFLVSLRSDAPHPASASLMARAWSYRLPERDSTALSPGVFTFNPPHPSSGSTHFLSQERLLGSQVPGAGRQAGLWIPIILVVPWHSPVSGKLVPHGHQVSHPCPWARTPLSLPILMPGEPGLQPVFPESAPWGGTTGRKLGLDFWGERELTF